MNACLQMTATTGKLYAEEIWTSRFAAWGSPWNQEIPETVQAVSKELGRDYSSNSSGDGPKAQWVKKCPKPVTSVANTNDRADIESSTVCENVVQSTTAETSSFNTDTGVANVKADPTRLQLRCEACLS